MNKQTSEVDATQCPGTHGPDKTDDEHVRTTKRIRQTTHSVRQIADGIWLAPVEASSIAACFTDETIFDCRDPRLDEWLSSQVSSAGEANATMYELCEDGMTFEEMARAIIDTAHTDSHLLENLALANGIGLNTKQVEHLIIQWHRARSSLLLANGWANLCFVQDACSHLFVFDVYYAGGWRSNVNLFRCQDRWSAGSRVLVKARDCGKIPSSGRQ